MIEAREQEQKIDIQLGSGICPDFDDDCKDVVDHFKCWIGGKTTFNGVLYECDTAKGTCPFIHQAN